jgi:hypothetical protein
MKKILILFSIVFLTTALSGQTKVVKGALTVFNRYPVANLEVKAKKAKTNAVTDAQGRFELVCNEKDNIVIQGKVFQSVSKRVGPNDNFMEENLIFKDSHKNRELATSLGYISQEDLAYAVKNLMHENNDYCNYPDIWSLIRNKFSTVQIRQTNSGETGVYFNRGMRSITGDNNAIYHLDGIKVYDISSVNPCEIAEITMISSGTAAKYGQGAANGVVVIRTKRAR